VKQNKSDDAKQHPSKGGRPNRERGETIYLYSDLLQKHVLAKIAGQMNLSISEVCRIIVFDFLEDEFLADNFPIPPIYPTGSKHFYDFIGKRLAFYSIFISISMGGMQSLDLHLTSRKEKIGVYLPYETIEVVQFYAEFNREDLHEALKSIIGMYMIELGYRKQTAQKRNTKDFLSYVGKKVSYMGEIIAQFMTYQVDIKKMDKNNLPPFLPVIPWYEPPQEKTHVGIKPTFSKDEQAELLALEVKVTHRKRNPAAKTYMDGFKDQIESKTKKRNS
jgi:hypothetical protein